MNYLRNEGKTAILSDKVIKIVPKQECPFVPLYDNTLPVQQLLSVDVTPNGEHRYTFEYVEGPTLREIFERNPIFTTEVAISILRAFFMLEAITIRRGEKIFILVEDNTPDNIVIQKNRAVHIDMLTAEWYQVYPEHYWLLLYSMLDYYSIDNVKYIIQCLQKEPFKNMDREWFITWRPDYTPSVPDNFMSEWMRKYKN